MAEAHFLAAVQDAGADREIEQALIKDLAHCRQRQRGPGAGFVVLDALGTPHLHLKSDLLQPSQQRPSFVVQRNHVSRPVNLCQLLAFEQYIHELVK